MRVCHRASFAETKSRAIWEGHGASFTETKSIIINSKRFPTFLRKRYFGGITQRHFWKQNPDKNFLNDFFFNLFQTKGALTVHFDPERPPSFDFIGGLFFLSLDRLLSEIIQL